MVKQRRLLGTMHSSAGKVKKSHHPAIFVCLPLFLILFAPAIQSIGNLEDGYTAFWSESHVSEDFTVALRLQIGGSIIRLATYHDDEFKEGVSLTIYDELARWEKYDMPFRSGYNFLNRHPFANLLDMLTGVTKWCLTLSLPGRGKVPLPNCSCRSYGAICSYPPRLRFWDMSRHVCPIF